MTEPRLCKNQAAPVKQVAAPYQPAVFAYQSDGVLLISAGDDVIILYPEELTHLHEFLHRVVFRCGDGGV